MWFSTKSINVWKIFQHEYFTMSPVYEIEHFTEINAFLWELLFNFEIQKGTI